MTRTKVLAGVLALVGTAAIAQTQGDAWRDLASGNTRFVEGRLAARRSTLLESQAPPVAVLGCADSRVPPEVVFDKSLGDLFVVRNAGNTPDKIAIGSLEYAVEHLHTKTIVVLGHMSCGAVAAACSGEKTETPNLEAVVAPIAPSCAAARHGGSVDLADAVKDHVHRSALALVANSTILKQAMGHGDLTIIEAVYELDTGRVVPLHSEPNNATASALPRRGPS